MQRPWRNAASLLALYGFLSHLIAPRATRPQPSSLKKRPQGLPTIWRGDFPNGGSLFQNGSDFCQIDKIDLTSLCPLQGILAQPQPWWKIQLFMWEPVLFGTWDGVFTSCMINIFGVVLFLRTGWLVVSDELVALERFWWACDLEEQLGDPTA